jgi:hypothetical protein
MANSLHNLVTGIVTYVTEHGGYITKTKLLKLLYLFDVEFYRVHRKTFTGFEWKYFHLGPWTREFEVILGDLVATGMLEETVSAKSEYDTKFYRSSEHSDFTNLFQKYSDSATLKIVLDTWGESSTGEILDYVYFRTEPMEHGIRNEPLDFTKILAEPIVKYKKNTSGKTAKEIEAARRELEKRLAKSTKEQNAFNFTPPRYDEEFEQALEKLDGVG